MRKRRRSIIIIIKILNFIPVNLYRDNIHKGGAREGEDGREG